MGNPFQKIQKNLASSIILVTNPRGLHCNNISEYLGNFVGMGISMPVILRGFNYSCCTKNGFREDSFNSNINPVLGTRHPGKCGDILALNSSRQTLET